MNAYESKLLIALDLASARQAAYRQGTGLFFCVPLMVLLSPDMKELLIQPLTEFTRAANIK